MRDIGEGTSREKARYGCVIELAAAMGNGALSPQARYRK